MASKNVFRPKEFTNVAKTVYIEPPDAKVEEVEEVETVEEYTGPTADDLRRESEAFKENWEQEKAGMIARAKEEADRIIKEAEETGFEELKEKNFGPELVIAGTTFPALITAPKMVNYP